MSEQIRVLYSSNAPWCNSGYGVQGRSLLPRLSNLPEIGGKENIGIFAWYGHEGGLDTSGDHWIYPRGTDAYGNDVIGLHTQHFRANVVVTLIDIWVLDQTAERVAPALWLPWFPIDCDPIPERVLHAMKGAHMPLTYSKWGHDLLTKAGVENRYIPHGVEPSVYRVRDTAEVAQFKAERFGADCEHLTMMVAANKDPMDRKAFTQNIRAWAEFAKGKPEAKLYLHTEPTARFGGVDLVGILRNLGIAERVFFPSQYEYGVIGMSADYLAMCYNSADVLLAASKSEGFGIPIIEAQACGVPVIVTNYSSMPELVRWGCTVEANDWIWTPLNSWWDIPDTEEITSALEELCSQRKGGWSLDKRQTVSQLIHDEYSWDKIVSDYWQPLMTEVYDAINPKPVKMQVPQREQPKRSVRMIAPEAPEAFEMAVAA